MTFSTDRAAPTTLTEDDQRRLLAVTANHVDGLRDHVIFSMALGTGMREHEILALNVGDISENGRTVRARLTLRVFKGSCGGTRETRPSVPQEVFVPDALGRKLVKLLKAKAKAGESVAPDAPLFTSRLRARLGDRALRYAFERWQREAAFDRTYRFHDLRHTALTNAYRATRDIRLVQRLARHANVQTTTIYAGPSDQDLLDAARLLPC